jgi:hypothetical protein
MPFGLKKLKLLLLNKEETMLTTSCDPNIEHVIFDCSEVVHLHDDVYLKLTYLEKEGEIGKLIGILACEEDGTEIPDGLIAYLQNGIWYRCENLNKERLSFIGMDSKGRIKLVE